MSLTARSGRLAVLVAWTGFLAWLVLADQVPRYLGPRTAWIVPAGAVGLAVAAVAYARWTRSAPVARRALTVTETLRLSAVLAPILVGLVMSGATLGSLAAGNKLAGRGIDLTNLAGSLGRGGKPIDFLLVRGAQEDPKLARERGIEPGRAVELTGFVYRPAGGPGRPLRLARFYITCCVADSVAIDVPVYATRDASAYRRDAWLHVSGVLASRHGELVVEGARVGRVPKPKHPYKLFAL